MTNKKQTYENLYMMDRVCPICQKLFSSTGEWVYKKKTGNNGLFYYCSWKCLRKAEADHEEKRAATYGGKPRTKNAVIEMYENGLSNKDIATLLDLNIKTVTRYTSEYEEVKQFGVPG